MYNNSFGYGVYKKSQVNVGNPYEIRHPARERVLTEEEPDHASELESAQKKAARMVEKAREEAQLIKREAEFEAQRILEDARKEAELMAEQLAQESKEEGYRYGEATAQQHYQDLIHEAQDFRDRAKNEYEETIRSLEEDIVQLALNIAKKVIGAELAVTEDVVVKLASETINGCVNRDHVILRVSAEDYDEVAAHQEVIKSTVSDLGQLEIKRDQSLKPGSCLVDTGFGMMDGGMDTRMEAIERAFFEVLDDQKANG